jgi:hypothetical protein
LSDTNRTKVGFVKEANFAVTPANPAFKNLRIKGSSLQINPKTKESAELRTDRMVGDLIRVANEAGGGLPLEVSFRSLDDAFENALQSAWQRTFVRDNNGVADSAVTDVSAGTGVYTFAAVANPVSDYSSGAAVVVGHLVRASGFTNAANNGLLRVSAVGAGTMTLGNASVAEAAPAAAARLKVVGFRGVAGDITATATGLASAALNFTTLGLAVGQWVKVGGSVAGEQFATAANNGWARIAAIAANALTLENLPVGWGVDAAAAKTITVWIGDYIRNGTTEQTWSVEQQYPDLVVPEYDVLVGMAIDQMALNFKQSDIVEGSVTFLGSDGSNSTARVAGATDIAAPTNDVLNTGANIGAVRDNGTSLTGPSAVTSLDLTITNSLRRRGGLGSAASQDVGSGTFRLNGKMTAYYASNAIRAKLLGGTSSSLDMRLVDPTAPNNKRGYLIDIPKIKYSEGNPQNSGLDTDRTIDPGFSALAHAYGYAFHLQRFDEFFE